ncbi:MAG: amidohydrolase family protein [Candidatus Cloacimonadota bacterium]|nr:amidohydrolase family protein [Candidatus Cloacimonadota bacterium]
MNIVLKNGYLIIPRSEKFIVKKQDIHIKDGIIQGKTLSKVDRIIDVQNRIVMPAFTNAHHHIYSTLSKGIPCQVPFRNFMGNLKQLWWTLDRSLQKDDMILSTVISAEESIKQGVTTICDHHISAYTENALSHMAEVFEKYSLSGSLAFEISDRNGEEFFQKSLQENIRFAQKQKDKEISGMIGLHASFTLSQRSLAHISEKTYNIPIHIHVAEGIIDVQKTQKAFQKGIVERLEDFQLLRKNSLLIHASNLEDKDLLLLQNKPVYLVQAIDSNLNNGLNIGNIHNFLKKDLKFTVGTDGMHSNVLKAMKNSMIFTKYQNRTPDIGYEEMQAMLWNNYKLKQDFGLPLGINASERADLAVFDYSPPTPIDNENFMGHFIFGITEANCQYVIKNDNILLDDYKLIINPYEEYKKSAVDISRKIFKRFEKNKNLSFKETL